MGMQQYANTDEYLSSFSGETRKKLDTLRKTIRDIVPPETKEKISYGIPTFTYRGNLVHFAGYKTHIGFYPGAAPVETFKEYLGSYKTSKGTIQFPLDNPLPLDLIRNIVNVCIERNLQKKTKASQA